MGCIQAAQHHLPQNFLLLRPAKAAQQKREQHPVPLLLQPAAAVLLVFVMEP